MRALEPLSPGLGLFEEIAALDRFDLTVIELPDKPGEFAPRRFGALGGKVHEYDPAREMGKTQETIHHLPRVLEEARVFVGDPIAGIEGGAFQ